MPRRRRVHAPPRQTRLSTVGRGILLAEKRKRRSCDRRQERFPALERPEVAVHRSDAHEPRRIGWRPGRRIAKRSSIGLAHWEELFDGPLPSLRISPSGVGAWEGRKPGECRSIGLRTPTRTRREARDWEVDARKGSPPRSTAETSAAFEALGSQGTMAASATQWSA